MGQYLAERVVRNLEDLYLDGSDPGLREDLRWGREEADAYSDLRRTRVAELTPERLPEAIHR